MIDILRSLLNLGFFCDFILEEICKLDVKINFLPNGLKWALTMIIK